MWVWFWVLLEWGCVGMVSVSSCHDLWAHAMNFILHVCSDCVWCVCVFSVLCGEEEGGLGSGFVWCVFGCCSRGEFMGVLCGLDLGD